MKRISGGIFFFFFSSFKINHNNKKKKKEKKRNGTEKRVLQFSLSCTNGSQRSDDVTVKRLWNWEFRRLFS